MNTLLVTIAVLFFSFIASAEEKASDSSASGAQQPLKFTFGGQAWVETESSQNVGYENSSNYFNRNAASAQRQFSSLMSILEFGVTRGNTGFNLNLQVGELYFGDPSTGGSYANKSTSTNPFYVRDAFLTHNLSEVYSLKAGVFLFNADPNGFIMSDHMSAFTFTRKHGNFSQTLWTSKMGDGKANKSTNSTTDKADSFAGLIADGKVTDTFNYNFYAVYRGTRETGNSFPTKTGFYTYTWYGLTMDYNPTEAVKTQITGISNGSTYAADTGATGSGNASSSLYDLRVSYNINAIGTVLTLEGLGTSGTASISQYSDRSNFISISPRTSYLLTLASNDGADDAPGAPKQLVAPLDNQNGVQIAVIKLEKAFGSINTMIRYGKINATVADSTTHSVDMGDEFDFQAAYMLDNSTQLQLDWAQFNPGSFYGSTQRDVATQLTASLKFKF